MVSIALVSVFAEVDTEEEEAETGLAVVPIVFALEVPFDEPVLDSLVSVEFEVSSDDVEAVSLPPLVTVIVVVYELVTVSTTVRNLLIPTVICWTGMSTRSGENSRHLLLEGR